MILTGECVALMATLDAESVDAIVTDPPYSLSFMGKSWDSFTNGHEDAGFCYWLSGLIDGEGCFTIKAHTRGTYTPAFTLKMRADEAGTLRMIIRTLGIGALNEEERHEPEHSMVKWLVQDKAGCQALVDLLDHEYPLRSQKWVDYLPWREAVCEWTDRPRAAIVGTAAGQFADGGPTRRLMDGRRYTEVAWSGRRYQDWCRVWGREALRVSDQGAHLVAFGGSRTYHRLAAGLEDAGFEIRDSLAYMFGSGFRNR